MDIDKQIGAISAEFWSNIAAPNYLQSIDYASASASPLIHSSHAQNILAPVNSVATSGSFSQQRNTFPIDILATDVEADVVALGLTTCHETAPIANTKQQISLLASQAQSSSASKTLCDLIDETLAKSSRSSSGRTSSKSNKNSQKSSSQQSTTCQEEQQYKSVAAAQWDENGERECALDRDEKNLQRKKANNQNKKWTAEELALLFDLLECFGTDFTIIQQYFERKTVTQIKNKFHKEEKKNPEKIKEVMFCNPSKTNKRLSFKLDDHSDLEKIQQYYVDKFLHKDSTLKRPNSYPHSNTSNESTTTFLASSPEVSPTITPEFHGTSNTTASSAAAATTASNHEASSNLISRLSTGLFHSSNSLKMVAEDIERRLQRERNLVSQ